MHSVKLSVEPLHRILFKRFLPKKLWLQGLLIQVVSYFLIANLYYKTLNSPIAFEFKSLHIYLHQIWIWLLLQVVIASSLASVAKMPIWWRWITAIFPVAVVSMQVLSLSPWFYLAGFLMTLALYWSVHNTRVPFYPSFPATWRAMLSILDQFAGDRTLKVLDIGSGIGDIAMFLSKQRPQDHVFGIEIAPLPWLISALRTRLSRSRAQFKLGNYHHLNFSTIDVVFAYLSPAAMEEVWLKVAQEMQPGSVFISSEFPVPGIQAQRILYPQVGSPALYVYQL